MRRLLHRLRAAWRPPGVAFVYHRDYAHSLPGVPLDPKRAEEILAFLLDEGLVRRRDVSRPIAASLENILRVHTPAYLDALQDPATMTGIFGFPIPDGRVQRILDHERLVVGGTIQATRLALMNGGRRIAVNLQGGMHHAAPERGMGFCVFNDIAVAIKRLQARGQCARALVIDLDLHDGNGTRAAFTDDPRVYTYSIHNADWDDALPPGAAPATRIALGSNVTDDRYLAVLRETLPPVVAAHRPDLVIYVAGCDPAAGDRIGDWRITPEGMLARDQFVTSVVRGPDLATPRPFVILPGGGYGSAAWRYSARFFTWLLTGRAHEPPGDMEAMLRRFRPIAQAFTAEGLAAAAPAGTPDDFGLTAEDLGEFGGAGVTRETRILGHYSKHGIELLFERLGFYAKLRAMGFPHPVLDVDFASGLGQTLRLFGDEAKTALLMELRLNRSRRVVPGMDVIFVEWLLLQNPRARFTDQVRRLPGQEHPGLGLLAEVVGWMVVACETIGLDGLVHVPSHYHLAVVGRHHLRFLQPELQAHFESLREVLRDVPLAEASRLLEAGNVVEAKTGEPVRYIPGPTVLPVSDRLRHLVTGAEYDASVRRHRPTFRRLN